MEFNKAIIDTTAEFVCAFKPQYAFYGAKYVDGITALRDTIHYIHKKYPDIPVVLDAKRNDIGNTSEKYATEVFDVLKADAVTVNPYLGQDACQPFLDRKDKKIICFWNSFFILLSTFLKFIKRKKYE
ncbi:orotidine-5'-phosphate decarboxylase [Patescibacteria group bacterium]|nr:orotidine-5'-phosphate decarboxylase [Patescibacteria group bacterium]MBU1519447.1 orotidine-5'-phosphate decarboxylase [Patescibacteria group bacterium]MBU2010465.1 orotidine-5'-phosphate decarboxylase [Patescibacteria group bacterium]MBU2416951.1 orotidine-5'-phosphate decarboxylase [Patescibacteria group bacterium]MBU2460823.1 orotidine-5'-phosphate decarboxylase [Patescibacteria group bacterium]